MKATQLKWGVQCLLCVGLCAVSHKVGSYGGSMGQILYQMLYSYMAVVAISVVLGDISLYKGERFSILAVVVGVFGGAVGFFVALFITDTLGKFVPYLPVVFFPIPVIMSIVLYNVITSWHRRVLPLKKKQKVALATVTNCIWIVVVVCVSFLGWCYVAKPSFYDWFLREKATSPEEATKRFLATGRTGEMKRLLKEGADINAKVIGGMRSLHKAATFGDVKTVKMLIDNGADVNAQDKDGNTALMSAWLSANAEVVQLLLSSGADPKIKNNKGISALDTAIEMLDISGPRFPERMEECARIIVQHAGKKDLIHE